MICSLLGGTAILVVLILCSPLQAQVSFVQPPTYFGIGNNSLFSADFNGDGKPDLLAIDSGGATLSLGNGNGTFRQGPAVAGTPLAVADFNGDGKPDILEQGTGTLLVLLGNGDGTFQTPVSTPSGANLSAIVATDLNGDGKPDVLGLFNGMLMVYIGKGDGTFAPGVAYNLSASTQNALITVSDFNGDKKMDIVVSTSPLGAAGQEIVFLGNGDGTFQAPKTSVGIFVAQSTAAGDFNGDGKADLIVGGSNAFPADDNTYILLGNGDGTFQAPTVAFPFNGPVAALDVNGDGKLDIILLAGPSIVAIEQGNGDGTFSNANDYVLLPLSTSFIGMSIAIADFNQDGKTDVAAGGNVLLSNGNGTFQGVPVGLVPSVNGVGFGLGPLVAGNFDKTSPPGVATLGQQQQGSVFVFSDNGGVLSLSHTYPLQQPGYAIATADFNGDGNLDLIVFGVTINTGTWGYSVLLGNGDGSFQSPVFVSESSPNATSGTGNSSVVVADFNGDKNLDVAVAIGSSQTLAVLLGNGDGTFGAPSYVFDAGGQTLMSADFNGDGKTDIAASTSNGTFLLFGNGDGTFQPAVMPSNLTGFEAAFTADFNNDGKPDLLFGTQVALGKGDGTFTLLPLPSGSFGPVQLADFNGDGKIDLLVAHSDSSHLVHYGVMLGNGDGTFGAFAETAALQSNSIEQLFVNDMNGDGKPDIIIPMPGVASGLAVMLNTTPPLAPDFAIAAPSPSSQSITPGQNASFTLSLTPSGSFSGTINLSCAITPAAAPPAMCTLSAPSVQISGSPQAVTVMVGTTAIAAATPFLNLPISSTWPLTWIVVLSSMLWLLLRYRNRRPILAPLLLVLALTCLAACGGGGSSTPPPPTSGTPAGTYTATVTGTSGAITHSATLQVVVQ